MASGHIFKLLKEIKDLNLDYEGAVRYLTDKGVEVTGIIKQGLNNFFKKNKARDVDFGSVVKKIPYDDFDVPFNPNNPLKNYSKGKDGVGTLFKNKSKTLADELAQAEGVETFETILPTKKLPDIKMGSRINYEAIADKAGIDVELIRGKNWEEIMEIIKGKADGGRVGFEIGGLSGEAQSIYDAWTSAGHSEADTLDYLTSRGMYNAGEGEKGVESIINTQQNIFPDTGGVTTSPIGTNVQNFYETIKPKSYQPPGKIQSFLSSGIDSLRQSKLGQMGASALGWLGDLPGAGILGQFDQFDQLPYEDQEFITSMMGYTDPETNMANKDPFGINVRSAFGNYGSYVDKMFNQNIGKEWKPGSWQAQRKTFYDNLYQKKEQDRIREELAKEEADRKKSAAHAAAQVRYDESKASGRTGGHWYGGSDYEGGASGDVTQAGPGRDPDDRMARGGLATMFTRRR